MIPVGCSVQNHDNLSSHTSRCGCGTVQTRPRHSPVVGVFVHHSPHANLLKDAIVLQGLAGHWAEILGPEVGQVNETREVGGGRARQLTTSWMAIGKVLLLRVPGRFPCTPIPQDAFGSEPLSSTSAAN